MKAKLQVYFSMIYYEWLKLRKQKLTYICLIILFILPIYAIKEAYGSVIFTSSPTGGSTEVINIESKEVLSGLDAIRYVDSELHKKYGDPVFLTSNFYDTYHSEYYAEKYLSDDEIDDAKMITYYGTNWKSLLEKSRNGTLRASELLEVEKEINPDDSTILSPEEANAIVSISPFYNESSSRLLETLQLLDRRMTIPDLETRKNTLMNEENLAFWVGKKKDVPQISPDDYEVLNAEMQEPFMVLRNIDKPMMDFLNNQYINASETFEAQYGISLVAKSINKINDLSPLYFLLFALLFASIFNQEYTIKTDQILKPTQHGAHQQAIAKISLCLGFTLLYGISTLLLCWLIPFFTVGFHDLDVVFQLFDIRSPVNQYFVSARTYMITMSSMYILVHFIFGSVICALSCLSRNSFSFLIKTILFIGIGLIGLSSSFSASFLYGLNYASPFTMQNMEYLFRIYEYYNYSYHSIGGFIISNNGLMWVIYSILCALLIYYTISRYTKRTVKNA